MEIVLFMITNKGKNVVSYISHLNALEMILEELTILASLSQAGKTLSTKIFCEAERHTLVFNTEIHLYMEKKYPCLKAVTTLS